MAKEKLIIDVVIKSKKANQNLKKLNASFNKLERVSRLNKVMSRFNLSLNKNNRLIDKNGRFVNQGVVRMGALQAKMKGLQNVFLGVGLATLFFGMAVKNASQNAIKGFTKTWATVMEGSTMYNETLGRLNASFQFLKFAIADAFLSSELGQNLIDIIIGIFDWVSSLSPEFLKWVFIGLIVAAVLGTILMVFGQISLAILGPIALLQQFPILGIWASNVFGKLWSIFKFMKLPILFVLIIIGLIIALVKIWKSDLSLTTKIILTIVAVMIALVLIVALFGVGLTIPLLILFALIGLAVALGIAFVTASDEFKLSFLKTIAAIGQAIFDYMLFPIKMLLKALSRVPGVGRMARGALGVLNSARAKIGMGDMISSLEAKIASRQSAQAEGPAEEKGFFEGLKAKAGEAKEGITNIFQVDTVNMADGTTGDDLGAGIDEASQYGSSAGI